MLAPGTGKTATGRLWVYLRDNRRWRPSDKPAALFRYSPDRKGERPREHLKAFTGFLQADAYAGFERLYDPDRKPGPITPVACWAHARRKLHDVYQADPSSVAAEGLRMVRSLYEAIEAWRRHYNTVRPHSSLGYRPPAPEAATPDVLPVFSSSLSESFPVL